MTETDKLYRSRDLLMIALMATAGNGKIAGYTIGWSKRHSDGELCFGGGWVIAWLKTPSGKEIRFHLKEEESKLLPSYFEYPVGTEWNGIEETEAGLIEIIRCFLPEQKKDKGYCVDDRLHGETHSQWCDRMKWVHQAGK